MTANERAGWALEQLRRAVGVGDSIPQEDVMLMAAAKLDAWQTVVGERQSGPIPVATEAEREPPRCSSVSPTNGGRCLLDEGHQPKHEFRWVSGSERHIIRWTDQEATHG